MLDHVRRKTRATRKRLRARLGHDDNTSSFVELLDLSRASDDKIAFMHQQSRLLADYEPGGYSGPVTLFRASTQPLFCSFSPDMGWGAVVGDGLEIKTIAGTHHDLLSAHADSLAKQLQDSLDGSWLQSDS